VPAENLDVRTNGDDDTILVTDNIDPSSPPPAVPTRVGGNVLVDAGAGPTRR
jgi:hypothetical protein